MEKNILNEEIQKFWELADNLKKEIAKKVVGQETLIRDMIVALFAGGHILLEGAPGLAKTLTIDTMSKALDTGFKRIQFTPDLLPSDLVGTKIYNPSKWDFSTKFGPIFTNFLLTDEINRAPSKVQSALLEAMAEKQVTIWDETYKLEAPFMVLATQNPIEQEGTYTLPEAQLDRFLLKTIVSYPTEFEEIQIMKNNFAKLDEIQKVLSKSDIIKYQDLIKQVYCDDKIFNYVRDLVFATREPARFGLGKIANYISYWLSPRASISVIAWAKVLAALDGRNFIIPEDIKEMAYPVFRHRIIMSYDAIADEVKTDDIIKILLDSIKVI